MISNCKARQCGDEEEGWGEEGGWLHVRRWRGVSGQVDGRYNGKETGEVGWLAAIGVKEGKGGDVW